MYARKVVRLRLCSFEFVDPSGGAEKLHTNVMDQRPTHSILGASITHGAPSNKKKNRAARGLTVVVGGRAANYVATHEDLAEVELKE